MSRQENCPLCGAGMDKQICVATPSKDQSPNAMALSSAVFECEDCGKEWDV